MLRAACLLVLVACGAARASGAERPESPGRALRPTDLSRFEHVRETALSPDGGWLAFVVARARASQPQYAPNTDWSDDGLCDVWLVSTRGGEPRRITRGAEERAGYWAPMWSPGGKRLAMLSNTGGRRVRIWSWEVASGELRPVDHRYPRFDPRYGETYGNWVSDDELLYNVLGEGDLPRGAWVEEADGMWLATEAWERAARGDTASASAIESGVPSTANDRPSGELGVLNLKTTMRTVVATGDIRRQTLSPSKSHVAYLTFRAPTAIPEPVSRTAHAPSRHYTLAMAALKRGSSARYPLDEELTRHAQIRWSPSSAALAISDATLLDGSGGAAPLRLWRVTTSGAAQSLLTSGAEPWVEWTATDSLLVRVRASTDGGTPAPAELLEFRPRSEQPRLVTRSTDNQRLDRLFIDPDGRAVLTLADGELWRLPLDGRARVSLTKEVIASVDEIAWTESSVRPSSVILTSKEDLGRVYAVDLKTAAITAIAKPGPVATVVAYEPRSSVVLFRTSDRDGTRLWSSRSSSVLALQLFQTNEFVREFAVPATRHIEYRLPSGDALHGWMVLPLNYEQGRRYPLITWVYGGSVFNGSTPPSALQAVAESEAPSPLTPEILAAHGYVVLFPSIPLSPERRRVKDAKPGDPMTALPPGVLGAIDKAIELGIADPDHVGVIGHSFGGYTVNGLLTQTNRFKAAVALAGPTDFVSAYGTFAASQRYRDHYAPSSALFQAEGGQYRMNGAPWQDAARYYRNSPVTNADKIVTPLLLLHGDMDFVGIQHAEEMFTALERQGKRVRFVRYWGEDHVIERPANVEHMWEEILRWFDSLLRNHVGRSAQ